MDSMLFKNVSLFFFLIPELIAIWFRRLKSETILCLDKHQFDSWTVSGNAWRSCVTLAIFVFRTAPFQLCLKCLWPIFSKQPWNRNFFIFSVVSRSKGLLLFQLNKKILFFFLLQNQQIFRFWIPFWFERLKLKCWC